MRGVGRNALDLPVAGLAAAAAAFVAFAMPGDLLAEAVGATGLPSILPAAAPPLGLTARIAIGVVGAAATFGLVLMLLRMLDRSMLGGAKPAQAPRPRRRDAHPDAPAPRPISAAREFGEPSPPVRPVENRPIEKVPDWMAEPEDQHAAAPRAPAPRAAAPAPAAPAPAARAPEPPSLPELMERLERGLASRRARPAAAAAPQVFPEPADDRLQSAIDSLHRLASRQP